MPPLAEVVRNWTETPRPSRVALLLASDDRPDVARLGRHGDTSRGIWATRLTVRDGEFLAAVRGVGYRASVSVADRGFVVSFS